jgi:hypothetical protein
MAQQTIRQASWANDSGYVDIAYEDTTNDVVSIIYANGDTRPQIVEVFRMPQNNLAQTFTIASGTPETTTPAPNNLKLASDAEGSLFLDRWRLQTRRG